MLKLSASTFEKHTDRCETILDNMDRQKNNALSAGIILTGDPGVGKTSFMHFFAKIVGLDLVVIEAPHISEEHVINIPFIVTKTNGAEKSSSFNLEESGSDFKIVLSDSNLLTILQNSKKDTDAQLLKAIYAGGDDLQKTFENLGGSKTEIPDIIKSVREHFTCILFLDEYFRQPSLRIKNILRGILDKKIGIDDLPENTYTIFASNMDDAGGGVSEVSQNQHFAETIKFATPVKDDWFAYLISKFKKDKKVTLKESVMKKFYEILQHEHLNFKDVAANVRTSPRRWEQIILYINSSLPVSNKSDAQALMANVHTMFSDYKDKGSSSITNGVLSAVAELIKETSSIEISSDDRHPEEKWRETLKHQLIQKMKLGEHRKYLPIMSGLPGIGKTAHAKAMAEELHLGFIYINCANLNAEDSVGIPLAETKGKKITTSFSEPKLLKIIDREIEKYKSIKENEFGFKYMIFFDEFNRVNNPAVFNGLRRVILEGKFSDQHKIPAGSIMVAAINPDDIGTAALTDHIKDVSDIISSTTTWPATVAYMRENNGDLSPTINNAVVEVMELFIKQFTLKSSKKIATKQLPFYLNIGGNDDIYIAPREYTAIHATLCKPIDRIVGKNISRKLDNKEVEELLNKLKSKIVEKFESTLDFIIGEKYKIKSNVFNADLEAWGMHNEKVDEMFRHLFVERKNKSLTSGSTLFNVFFDHPAEKMSESADMSNYLETTSADVFQEELLGFLKSKLETESDFQKHVLQSSMELKSSADLKDYQDALKSKFKELGLALKDNLTKISNFEHFIASLIGACREFEIANDKVAGIRHVVARDILADRISLLATRAREYQEAFMADAAKVKEQMKNSNIAGGQAELEKMLGRAENAIENENEKERVILDSLRTKIRGMGMVLHPAALDTTKKA